MSRIPLVSGLLIAVALSACDPGASTSTTVAPTTAPPATVEPTTIATTEPTTAATAATPTTIADRATAVSGDIVNLPQFGLQFQVPAPFVETPEADYDFSATSVDPQGFLTILDCGDCTLELPTREGETHRELVKDGVPAVIIENAALDLPDGVTANELVVVDGQRNFSVIMSFAGDIAPVWTAFIDSITFSDADPNAATSVPAGTGATATENGDGSFTLESVGLTFVVPSGFAAADQQLDEGFVAAREGADEAVLYVFPCPECTREEMDDGETTLTDITIDGQPAVVGETAIDDGETAKGVVILVDGQQAIATMFGPNIDAAWDEFIASIKITPI